MTHHELVEQAAIWLRRNGYNPVLAEPHSAGWSPDVEIPDALGWHLPEGHLCLIECKTSEADYNKDRSKRRVFRPRWRYYLTPVGLDLLVPQDWGWIQVGGDGDSYIRQEPSESTISWAYREHDVYERNVLLNALKKSQTSEGFVASAHRFREWYDRVIAMVREYPGITAHRLAKLTDHQCKTLPEARRHLREAVESGRIAGITVCSIPPPTVFWPERDSTDAAAHDHGGELPVD